jgi:hypothetical protein
MTQEQINQLAQEIKQLDWYAWDRSGMKHHKEGVPIEDVFVLRQDVISAMVEMYQRAQPSVTNQELVEALKEYNQLITDELNDLVGVAAVHGWKSNRVEQGEKLREKIKRLEEISPLPLVAKENKDEEIRKLKQVLIESNRSFVDAAEAVKQRDELIGQVALAAAKYGFEYRDNSQYSGQIPEGNILQWLQWYKSQIS